MRRTFGTFWLPAVLSTLLLGALVRFGISKNVPFVDQLLAKSGAPGLIATIVLGIALWVLIALLFRRMQGAGEMSVILNAKRVISSISSHETALLDDLLQREIGIRYNNSMFRKRFLLLSSHSGDSNRSDRVTSLMAGQSGVDTAHTQSAYGPLRALIWALPSFGFMGTAFEMADAVGGLGSALSTTQGYSDLRNVLVAGVVPHLAGAFDITLFALSSSVVCFLILSLVFAYEETILTEADAASLQMLAKIKDYAIDQPASMPASLVGELQSLRQQCEQLNVHLAQLQQADGFNTVAPLVHIVGTKVSQINTSLESLKASLDQELVIVRRPHGQ